MCQFAKLLFDTATTGALVGTRSLGQAERSLLFSADPFALDMVVFDAGGGVQVLHGQLLDAKAERPVAGARVVLGDQGESVETDHFGEFSISTLEPLAAQVLRIHKNELDIRCTVPGVPAHEGDPS